MKYGISKVVFITLALMVVNTIIFIGIGHSIFALLGVLVANIFLISKLGL